jgi:hypothetical protein
MPTLRLPVTLSFVVLVRDRRARMLRSAAAAAVCALASLSGGAGAQAAAATDTGKAPAAAPADVASMDAIIHSLYDVISGPAGPRDWRRFRSLFAPGARLIPTVHDSSGHISVRAMTPDAFAERGAVALQRQPFYEGEISHTVESFGAITQVFSTYASRRTPDGAPFARGINSIQLLNDGTRWYCVTIYWDAERPGTTIPDRYLKKP